MLSETVYKGASCEAENPVDASKLVKRSDLSSSVQSSQVEIDAYLKKLGVVETGGYLRLLSKEVVQETIQQLFLSILSEGWSIDSIDESRFDDIADVDSVVLKHVLQLLGSQTEERTWRLNLIEVLKASAHLIFAHHSSENKVWQLGSDRNCVFQLFLRFWSPRFCTSGSSRPLECPMSLLWMRIY